MTTTGTFTPSEMTTAAALFSAYWGSRDATHVSEAEFTDQLMLTGEADIVAEVVEMLPHLDFGPGATDGVLAALPLWIGQWKAAVERSRGQRRPTESDVAEAVARSIAEIIADINAGILPWDVNSFGVLHDYVDANEYGGLCDGDAIDWLYGIEQEDADHDAAARVQDAVHDWLVDRARRLGITEHRYDPSFARGPVRYTGQPVATSTDEV